MDKKLQDSIAIVHKLAQEPDFRERAEKYMRHRYIFGNTDPIYKNHTPIYDCTGRAIRYLQKEEPELFEQFQDAAKAADKIKSGQQIQKSARLAKIDSATRLITNLNLLQGGPLTTDAIAILNLLVTAILTILKSESTEDTSRPS